MSYTTGLNICAIVARIKKYKSIIKKKKKRKELLTKTNLFCINDLPRSLTNCSYIEHNYFHLIDVLRKYDYMEKEIKKL